VKVEAGAVARAAFSSGSGPLRWAASYLPTMTRAQQKAFRNLLSLNPRGLRAHIAANPTSADQKKWEQAVQTAVTLLAQHLGVSLSTSPALPIIVKLMSAPDPDGAENVADAGPIDKNGNWASAVGPGVSCRIRVYPIAWQSSDPDLPIADVAHEVVHCFQFKLNPADYGTPALAPWLAEGGAEWAGSQVAKEVLGHDPHDKLLIQYWNGYLRYPSVGLFSRVYSAIGFFAHLAETTPGGNIWSTLREMFKAKGGSSVAYALAVPDSNTAFLDSWASGYARDPSMGPGWDTTGVGITATKPLIPLYAGSSNTQVTLDAAPRASSLAKVLIDDQVLQVTGTGVTPFGRLRDSAGTTFSLEPGAYCVQGKSCTCPAGTPGFGSDLPTVSPGVAWVALSANNSASHVTLTRMTATNWCKEPASGSGGGQSSGASQLAVSGAATGSSYVNGRNDSCAVHQQSLYPPGVELTCLFEIAEPGSPTIAQLSFSTFHYTGPGYYQVTDRGATVGPDVGFADLSSTFTATEMPPDVDPGGFTISAVNGNLVSGGINATMDDVTSPGIGTRTVSAGGTFTVPLQVVP
jgi:hypothetical protein